MPEASGDSSSGTMEENMPCCDEQHVVLLVLRMNEISFEWDSSKAASNAKKHGVSFEEARTVFFDEHALLIPDPDHSTTEDRFIIMGLSSAQRVLVIVHCFRQSGSSIRLISARRAGTKEQQPYWENKK